MNDEIQSQQEMELYIDGLEQVGVINNLGEDRYIIDKKFYTEGIKIIDDIYTIMRESGANEFEIFNMAMFKAMELRLKESILNEDELNKYYSVLVSSFASSGVYEQLFPNWKEMMGVEEDE